jgi:hypothetical protein
MKCGTTELKMPPAQEFSYSEKHLPPDDILWKLVSYKPSLETTYTSVIPSLAAMSTDDLLSAVALNRHRLSFMGIKPETCEHSPICTKPAGAWSITFGKEPPNRPFMRITGTQKQASLVSVFVDGLLLSCRRLPERFNITIRSIKRLKPLQTLFLCNQAGQLLFNSSATHYSSPQFKRTRAHTDLRLKIIHGYYLNKKNRLQQPHFAKETSQLSFFRGYDILNSLFQRLTGYTLYLSHGTLLGMVRDGKLIPSDDDFDCAYFSKHTNATDAFHELLQFGTILANEGISVHYGLSGHLKISISNHEYDIMPSWFDGTHFCVSSYSALQLHPGSIFPLRHSNYQGIRYFTIAAPEQFLRLNYGPYWHTPDPFYRSERSLVARANHAEFLRIFSRLTNKNTVASLASGKESIDVYN